MLNVSGDHKVSINVFHEISTYSMEAPTCIFYAIFITIVTNN